MIIRSQKKSITNLNNIDTICIEPNHCGCDVVCFNGPEESRSKIGEYSTEEKAIKVLDMICEAYVKSQALYIDRENNSRVITQNIAVQMPSDEEVEV